MIRREICTLLRCHPQVGRVSDDLFGAIVEVISKRTNLRLELQYRKQPRFVNDDYVPILGWTVVSWQCEVGAAFREDCLFRDTAVGGD